MIRRNTAADPSASPAERLLVAILTDTAGFDGAACEGEHDLFDPRDHDRNETPAQALSRHHDAAQICQSCPVLERCREWSEGESRHGGARGVLGAVVPAADPTGAAA